MPNISRRHFLRNISMGAAAAGVAVAAGPGSLIGTSGAAEPVAHLHEHATVDGTDVIAHVVDARSGQIAIYVGTRQVNLVNRDLAQQLVRATHTHSSH